MSELFIDPVADWGAVGDGVTDDSAAFRAMMLAINSDTSVYDTRAATILLGPRTYYLASSLRIHCPVLFQGANEPSTFGHASSVLKFAAGHGVHITPFRGYDRSLATGASLRDVGIHCVPIANVSPFPFDSDVLVGQLFYLPHDHQHVYEVVRAGRTQTLPASVWAPNTAYAYPAVVVPNVPNGHKYLCLQAGVSGASEPIELVTGRWNFERLCRIPDGDCEWREDGLILEGAADVAMAPFVDANHPSVLWIAGQTYEYNTVVRVPGVWDVVFWMGLQTGGPVSGVAGTTPPTSGPPGSTFSDGGIVWTRFEVSPYLWTSGTAILQPCRHPGLAMDTHANQHRVFVQGTTNNAVHVVANGPQPPARNVNFSDLIGIRGWQCHGFICVRGSDANAITIADPEYQGTSAMGEPDYGIADRTLAGMTLIAPGFQDPGGYPIESATGTGRTSVIGGYQEATHKSRIVNGIAINHVGLAITNDSFVRDPMNGLNIEGIDRRVGGDLFYAALAGRTGLPRGMFVGWGSQREPLWFGPTHSSQAAGGLPHEILLAYGPDTYGAAFAAIAMSTEGADGYKDDGPGIARLGRTRFPRGYIDLGAPNEFGPNRIWFRADMPTTGKWRKGDIVVITDDASSLKMQRCTVSGDFAGTPPQFEAF